MFQTKKQVDEWIDLKAQIERALKVTEGDSACMPFAFVEVSFIFLSSFLLV